ncbi:hypothetical protein AYO45_01560 [Gammaproteobacteria bacterium SCGC AG-212-F23]|nr:hypothetical protein AYO45_01560 [Gammaproteobacteria bacterium SCGC AG-212-F23]
MEEKLRPMMIWTLLWLTSAIIFGVLLGIYFHHTQGPAVATQKTLEYFSGYLLEESLSVDNLFVFLVIFSHFKISFAHQRRVLSYGIMGAVVLRFAMIAGGVWLITHFHWMLHIFGIFLLLTGIKLFFVADKKASLKNNALLEFLKKHLRVTQELHGNRFFVKQNRKLFVTPLFLVLIFVELSDIIFAMDSIPAIFAVTNDVFIIFTSNIFAILGLRSLYFLLAHAAKRFYYLKYGVALIIVLVGIKMLIGHWIHIPISWTLASIVIILSTAITLSVRKNHAY